MGRLHHKCQPAAIMTMVTIYEYNIETNQYNCHISHWLHLITNYTDGRPICLLKSVKLIFYGYNKFNRKNIV